MILWASAVSLIFTFMLRITGAKIWIDFHIFMAIFALLWLHPYHNAELFVPILVWGHCAIFYRHFTTCFCESFFILSWTSWITFICNFFYGKAYGISCDSPNSRWIWLFLKKFLLEKTIGIIRKQCTKIRRKVWQSWRGHQVWTEDKYSSYCIEEKRCQGRLKFDAGLCQRFYKR